MGPTFVNSHNQLTGANKGIRQSPKMCQVDSDLIHYSFISWFYLLYMGNEILPIYIRFIIIDLRILSSTNRLGCTRMSRWSSGSMVGVIRVIPITLPETKIATENRVSQKKFIFQPSIFMCDVSFSEGNTPYWFKWIISHDPITIDPITSRPIHLG